MISVVLSVYKNVNLFDITLNSILNQSISENIEVIVIDDGNTMEDSAYLFNKCLNEERIKYFKNKENIGLTKSLIRGCNLANGQYIARIDNGDIMVSENRLEDQQKILEAYSDVAIVGGAIELISFTFNKRYISKAIELPPGIIENPKRWTTLFPHMTVMFRKRAYDLAGGYDKDLKTGQDTDLWPRLLEHGKAYRKNSIFAIAPMMDESISVANNTKQYISTSSRNLKRLYTGEFSLKGVKKVLSGTFKIAMPKMLRLRLMYSNSFTFNGKINTKDKSVFEVLNKLYKENYE